MTNFSKWATPIKSLFLTAIIASPCAAGSFAFREDYDFDGDKLSDPAVYHSRDGIWYVRNSSNRKIRAEEWGNRQMQPVMGDFDGDQKADFCVYDARSGTWFVLGSGNDQVEVTKWGNKEQEPMVGDYNGDGLSDYALYHPASGNWLIRYAGNLGETNVQWGWPAAEPVPGDYDGDGKTDCAVYERAKGKWFILQSSNRVGRTVTWGGPKQEPAQADYDGDGRTDPTVYVPSSGEWLIRKSKTGKTWQFKSGWKQSQPVVCYFDADNAADPTVYEPKTGTWRWRLSGSTKVASTNWGWADSEAAASAYRVEDDATYYGVTYNHDYDDDSFSKTGAYPRTGTGSTAPVTPPSVTNPPPDPSPSPSPDDDPVNLSNAEWRKGSYGKNGRREEVLTSVKLERTRIRFETNGRVTWDNIGKTKDIQGDVCLFKYINGKLVGGKFDGCRRGQTMKGLENILAPGGNYLGRDWHMVSGETVYFCLIGERNGKAVRSNVLKTKYP